MKAIKKSCKRDPREGAKVWATAIEVALKRGGRFESDDFDPFLLKVLKEAAAFHFALRIMCKMQNMPMKEILKIAHSTLGPG